MSEHIITAFASSRTKRGDVGSLAVDEDGLIVGQHYSSSESWARHDIGVGRKGEKGRASWKDKDYDRRYPDGWVVEWTDDDARINALANKARQAMH